jgi:predicted nucleotide-binding protein
MAKPNPKPAKAAAPSKKERTYLSQADVPWCSVDKSLTVAQAIIDNYGNGPAKPLDVAQALQIAPTNSDFKMLTGASIAYGLTEGGWNAAQISLTPLAIKILKYKSETDTLDGKREALLKPRILKEFLAKYNDNAVPRDDIAHNVLESMGVPKDRTKIVLDLIISGAESVGFLTDIKGKKYVNLKGVTPTEQRGDEEQQDEEIVMANGAAAKQAPDKSQPQPSPAIITKPGTEARLARVFISHGKNRVFVDPIKQLLEMVQLQAVVSVESSTVSQPVTQKVMNDMRSSGAAIIHVDSEQKLIDPADTKEVVVLNPNVMIEIGAAMALYGERYILLVRDGVKLPSNLQGLYEVRYKGDKLDSDETIALLKSIHDMKTKALPS